MAISTGKIVNIKYGDDYGFVTIAHTNDTLVEVFILWFDDTLSGGPIAMYSMLLSIALAQGLTVAISHDDASAYISMVRVPA